MDILCIFASFLFSSLFLFPYLLHSLLVKDIRDSKSINERKYKVNWRQQIQMMKLYVLLGRPHYLGVVQFGGKDNFSLIFKAKRGIFAVVIDKLGLVEVYPIVCDFEKKEIIEAKYYYRFKNLFYLAQFYRKWRG